MNGSSYSSVRMCARAAVLAACAALGPPAALALESPARSWLSIWENTNNVYSGGASTRATNARILNPADANDPAALPAHVTVTYFQSACWGAVAAQESQTIPPGSIGSLSSFLATYPASLSGNGCLWIRSDVPVVPLNGRIEDSVGASGSVYVQWSREVDFWRTAKMPAPRWTAYWEDVVALGGSQYGGISTSGWVLNPARQKSRAEPLPAAHVTVTFRKGACAGGAIWKQETLTLAPGQYGLFFSALLSGDDNLGFGCLDIASDQPVVPLNGYLYSSASNAASAAALDFQPVTDWVAGPAEVQP